MNKTNTRRFKTLQLEVLYILAVFDIVTNKPAISKPESNTRLYQTLIFPFQEISASCFLGVGVQFGTECQLFW
jgi:preprotein translocase subunit SecA